MRRRRKDHSTEIILERKQSDYETSQNPLYLIEAFLISRENGVAPSGWTLEWIEVGFKKYLENRGKGGLDRAFGLCRRKGQRSWFTEKEIAERDKALTRKVIEERVRSHLLIKEACFRVWKKEMKKRRPHTRPIGYRRVKDIYYGRSRASS
jgi:hypothetical protein